MKRAVSIAVVSLLLSLPASAATILQNGSFEDVSGGSVTYNGGNWKVYSSIPGWTTVSGSGIEVQTNATLGSIDAHTGNRYVELDSHPGPNSNSKMKQNVLLEAGSYVLSFWYSPRDSRFTSNDIGYSLGTFVSGLVKGPVGTIVVGKWTQITQSFTVTKKEAGSFALKFWASGDQNTYGGLIDDVALDYTPPAPVPVPAAGLLMLGGLGGLAALKRRRRA
jgi:hypothetical protein